MIIRCFSFNLYMSFLGLLQQVPQTGGVVRWGASDNRHLLPTVLGAASPISGCAWGWVLLRWPLLGVQTAISSLCPHMVVPLCVSVS